MNNVHQNIWKNFRKVLVSHPLPTALSLLMASSLLCSCVQTWESDVAVERLPASLLGLGVAPDRSVVPLGEGLQFVATGYYSDQETRDLTDVVEWQSWRADVLTVSSSMDHEGAGHSVAPGSSRVRALYMGFVSNELRVTVTDALVEQLTVSPGAVEMSRGQELELRAEALFSDGNRGNVSGSVRWITGDSWVVTVGPTGRLTARSRGSTEVRAVYEHGSEVVEGPSVHVEVLGEGQVQGPPDLRIVSVHAGVLDDVVSWTLEIENVGERAATDLWIDAWLDRDDAPPSPPTAGDAWRILPFLAAGESSSVQLQLSGVAPGEYSSWLLVDSLATNFEGSSGESNNVSGPELVTVSEPSDGNAAPGCGGSDPDCSAGGAGSPTSPEDPAGAADLVVAYFEGWSFEEPDEVLYFIDVSNVGTVASGPFELAVFSDLAFPPEAPVLAEHSVQVESLAPGETDYLSAVIEGLPSSSWTSFALADAQDEISELLEGNNYGQFQVTP